MCRKKKKHIRPPQRHLPGIKPGVEQQWLNDVECIPVVHGDVKLHMIQTKTFGFYFAILHVNLKLPKVKHVKQSTPSNRLTPGFDIFFAVVFTLELLLRLLAHMAMRPKAPCAWETLFFFRSRAGMTLLSCEV